MVWYPCSPRDFQESSPTPQLESINSSVLSLLYGPTLTPFMTTGKTIALTRQTFAGKEMSLLFNMLSRLIIAFLPRSGRLLISWLQSPSAVILEPKKIKSVNCFHCFPIYLPWSDDQMPWSSFFECWASSQLLHSPLSLLSRGSLVPLELWTVHLKMVKVFFLYLPQ